MKTLLKRGYTFLKALTTISALWEGPRLKWLVDILQGEGSTNKKYSKPKMVTFYVGVLPFGY